MKSALSLKFAWLIDWFRHAIFLCSIMYNTGWIYLLFNDWERFLSSVIVKISFRYFTAVRKRAEFQATNRATSHLSACVCLYRERERESALWISVRVTQHALIAPLLTDSAFRCEKVNRSHAGVSLSSLSQQIAASACPCVSGWACVWAYKYTARGLAGRYQCITALRPVCANVCVCNDVLFDSCLFALRLIGQVRSLCLISIINSH